MPQHSARRPHPVSTHSPPVRMGRPRPGPARLAGDRRAGRRIPTAIGETMSTFRPLAAVFALLLVASSFALPAAAQQHWLIGSWKGSLGGISTSNPYGTDRTLKIVSVEGSHAKGQWIGPTLTQGVAVTVEGDNVSFFTPGGFGATYKLVHNGNALEGSWQGTSSGKSGSVSLTRQ